MGVGTFLTNDFIHNTSPAPLESNLEGKGAAPVSNEGTEKSKPLNIVIKLYKINGKPCVKISDEMTKTTGDQEAVEMVKHRFGLDQKSVSL